MKDQRAIIEMGMGNDLHGMDYTKAASRAIDDALRHSSLALLRTTGIDPTLMRIVVTIGVQQPDKIDTKALQAKLPYGTVEIRLTQGGLDSHSLDTDSTIVIAAAAVEVFLPYQGDAWRPDG